MRNRWLAKDAARGRDGARRLVRLQIQGFARKPVAEDAAHPFFLDAGDLLRPDALWANELDREMHPEVAQRRRVEDAGVENRRRHS